ncbi:ABC transporter permease [Bradyrhizobium sp. DOA9]|uniref:ABC transporter permease n=1 Tax=Bradyrhizobium sp. DOA9 TaxID=1126627 RepID=UPI00046B0009|nr:ABC transporter permease [Bradyrhizobium sp. DOA9]GAJ37752.1 nodulation protein J [Bradyrhizobium sp. DOA9]
MRVFYGAAMPAGALNWVAVWHRNFWAWKKIAIASLIGNLADPLTNLLGLGFGLGLIVGRVHGTSYIDYLVGGMVATSAMTSASFETLYATFARLHSQGTWEAMLCTQLTLGDILLGEVAWAASKALLAGIGISTVAGVLGYAAWPSMLCALPAIVLTGVVFASLAMVVIAVAPSYDFFVFYQTLVVTPMIFLCGAVVPTDQLPTPFQVAAVLLPLKHSIELIRPAMLGRPADGVVMHVMVLLIYAVVSFLCSGVLLLRRLMR